MTTWKDLVKTFMEGMFGLLKEPWFTIPVAVAVLVGLGLASPDTVRALGKELADFIRSVK